MNIALISPFSKGPIRGNITTVSRIASHLQEAGCKVTTLAMDTVKADEATELLQQLRPDLLHAFHAYHVGPTARQAAQALGIPYIVTITGSDLFDLEMRNDPLTGQAIADASAVTCFDSLVAEQLADAFPEAFGKIAVITQGVAPLPIHEPFPRAEGEFLLLLPAPLRPVKGILEAITGLARLAEEFPNLRLLIAGGEIDPVYSATIRERAASLAWVRLLGEVPYDRMGALYAAADLVLNCSIFEGGMANALLEAMIMGRPVLASEVLGNRSLIRQNETGWLYNNEDELVEHVRLMLLNPWQGREIGEAGRRFVLENCSPRLEAQSYVDLYARIIVYKTA